MPAKINIRKIKIEKRLNLGLFLVIFIPVFLICVFTYQKSSNSTRNKISAFSLETMIMTGENIHNTMIALENYSIDIAYSETLQETLLHYDKLNDHELYLREKSLADTCTKKFVYNSFVTDVIALTNDRKPVFLFGNTTFRLRPSPSSLDKIISTLEQTKKMVAYFPTNETFEQRLSSKINFQRENGFVLCRKIRSSQDNHSLGMLVMKVNDSYLKSKYEELNLGENSQVFILNSDLQVISTTNEKYRSGDVCRELDIERLYQSPDETGKIDLTFSGNNYLGVYSKIEGTDWLLLGLIPYDYINTDSFELGVFILGIGILCSSFAFIIGRCLSKSITEPLRGLDCAMSVVVENLDIPMAQDDEPDELGELNRKFFWMANELKYQIQQVIEKENQKRESEIKALQYQVNPHFLANTINTIAYLAKIQGVDNIERVSKALVDLMLASSGKEGSLVPISREIQHIQNYMYIQEYKFGNDVIIQYEIAPEILDDLVPCFILQPLVENALIHGIGDNVSNGIIMVKGYLSNDRICFEITDNGVGMDQEKIRRIFLDEKTTEKKEHLSGIGIKNVNERIQILFGSDFGLEIHSVPNQMTQVKVTLPMIR